MAQIYVKEHYQNIEMEQPIAPGSYSHKKLPRSAVLHLIEHKKAEWVGDPPPEYATDSDEPAPTETTPPEYPDFFEMTVPNLKLWAVEHDLVIPPSITRKDDIVAFLEASVAKAGETSDESQAEDSPPPEAE